MNLLQDFKNYLLNQKPLPSAVTVKNYLSDINKFVAWFEKTFGTKLSPPEITREIIERFRESSLEKFSVASVDRYTSSLHKFINYLYDQKIIQADPFEEEAVVMAKRQQEEDPWDLRGFKNFLQIYNSSHLTIKNYIIDVKQFFDWIKQSHPEFLSSPTSQLIEEYRDKLFREQIFSASSINRKLSSLRKYISWISQNNSSYAQDTFHVANIKPQQNISKAIPLLLKETTPLVLEKKRSQSEQTNLSTYSKLAPVRVLQKSLRGWDFLIENFLVTPSVQVINSVLQKVKSAKKQSIFNQNEFSFYNKEVRNVSKFHNISKETYAPLDVSLDSLPLLKKTWIILRYKRPQWYKRYHNYAIAHYFNISVLIIFSTAIGFAFYNSFVTTPSKQDPLLAAGKVSYRTLDFSVKLTDDDRNPITTSRNLRFTIYDDPIASDSSNHKLWEEVRTAYPNKDGVFSVVLGSGSTPGNPAKLCNDGFPTLLPTTTSCAIPENIFLDHKQIYLGVSVENQAELVPRQQLANVTYATTADSVQSLKPITDDSVTTNTNTLLALNSSGTLSIPGTSTTTIESPGGKLALSGNTLSLNTATGSNANIELYPDGFGFVDIQKPVQNSSDYSNIRAPDGSSPTAGAVEIDDLFAILATSSGQSAFTINQNGDGPIISASSSGTAKFTVDNRGNIFAAGDLKVRSIFAENLGVSGNITSDFIPASPYAFNLGSQFSPWKDVFARNFYSPSTGGVAGYLQLSNGALSPTNITNDLLIGGTSTSSAVWQVFATGPHPGTASTSGNLSFRGANPTINVLNGGSLSFQTSPGSDEQLVTRLTISSNGNVGIGITSPIEKFQVSGDIRVGNSGTNGCIKDASGGAIAGTCSSDIRLKENIQPLSSNILDKVTALEPVTFNWNQNAQTSLGFGPEESMGLIAQQVESVLPGLVEDNGQYGYKAVKYQQLPFYLLEALREQQQQLKGLTAVKNDLSLTDAGNLAIVQNQNSPQPDYSVVSPLGEIITNISDFATIIVGNIKAGVVRSQEIFADNITIAGQSLQDYIISVVRQSNLAISGSILSPLAEIDQVHTNIISPLGDNPKIAIAVKPDSIEIRNSASGSAVAIIDNSGNASFSGSVKSSLLAVNGDATIAGTLRAGKIMAGDIEGLSEKVGTLSAQYITNINNVYYATASSDIKQSIPSSIGGYVSNQQNYLLDSFVDISSMSGLLASVKELQSTTLTVDQGLVSFGPTSLSDTSITGQLSIGSQLILADNGVNVLGADLELQPLKQGGISFLDGAIRIDPDGNLMVNGNSTFKGVLSANIISPLPDQDLTIQIGTAQQPNTDSKLAVKNASGSAVFTLDQLGNLIASGSASIAKLNLTVVPQAYAISDTEVIATGSAGTASINPYRKEVTIDSPLVTEKSLIYISPVGSSTQQPYLLRQVPQTSFTVGIKQSLTVPTKFNWLIIN